MEFYGVALRGTTTIGGVCGAGLQRAIGVLSVRRKQLCGARTRRGTSCLCKALPNGRCKFHGGMSTGPRTPMGRLRALHNLRPFCRLTLEELEQRLVEAETREAG